MSVNIVEVEHLKKHYPPDVKAVDDISFTIKSGEIFSMLGPNGAGKTTTVEILEGLRTPTSGDVKIFDENVRKDYDKIRYKVGILPQNFEPFELLKPIEALSYWSGLFSMNTSKKELDALIDSVGLTERKNILSKKLSGGEKRKLGIALSVINNPDLLFLDEPTTGLDPKARRDVWRLITEICEKGTTVLLTTHYLDEAEKLADNVAVMNRGKIIAEGSPEYLVEQYGKKTVIVLVGAGARGLEEVNRMGFSASETDGDVYVSCTGRSEMRDCFAKISSMDMPIKDMYTKRETLEDVFLNLVGKMENGVLQQ